MCAHDLFTWGPTKMQILGWGLERGLRFCTSSTLLGHCCRWCMEQTLSAWVWSIPSCPVQCFLHQLQLVAPLDVIQPVCLPSYVNGKRGLEASGPGWDTWREHLGALCAPCFIPSGTGELRPLGFVVGHQGSLAAWDCSGCC